ncbi:hypothetical protein MNBD_ALPHA12-2009 [hydrothermal vent metagenome]|uniref:Methyltransferase domain-containing protein n=1 Tax=hydrothermal vent metagenome TaxID=652676 RepID=A0A3B0TRL4_9ZZZZ
MWNERFAEPGYLFGTEPAQFLREHEQYLIPGGRALAVADGEGRNSVFLASKGLDVTAMDGSSVAVEKARELAKERGVTVDFNLADIMEWDWQNEAYDLVVAIFIQFSGPEDRQKVFAGLKKTLKKGGILMLHGYTVEQLEHGTGGPPCAENLYTTEMLSKTFSDMEILHLKAYERDVDEGRAHSGRSSLIDLIARKK